MAESAAVQDVGEDAVEPKATQIFTLVRQGNTALARQLLDNYPHLWSCRDEEGHSILHWAALCNDLPLVRAAQSNAVDVDATADNKQTPLMWATLRGHLAIARALLDAKANIQAHDSLGATPLIIAVQHHKHAMILLFMQRVSDGARFLADSDKNGCTATHWAAYKGDDTALKLLDYFQADLSAVDTSGMTPLHRAVFGSQAVSVRLLVERKADLNVRNSDGKTPLDLAESNADKTMQILLKSVIKSHSGKGISEDREALMEEGKAKKESRSEVDGSMSRVKKDRDKVMQKGFPMFWLVCVSLATFEYLTDLRTLAYTRNFGVSLLFEICVPGSLALFAFAALSNPGIIPSKVRGNSGVEVLMRAMDKTPVDGKEADISRLCTTTWVLKDLRTKYCKQTGACVREFDHYCIWLNCAIGGGNHRQFVLLAFVEVLAQFCHIYMLVTLSTELVSYESFTQWLFEVLTGYPLMACILIAHILTAPWILLLGLHQIRLVLTNLTTNEIMNMSRYDHFFVNQVVGQEGRMKRVFRNPFDKGSYVKNCLDFWWTRRRSDMGPSALND
eukprot:TRINITY_DN48419_c0_g1_i1.p1 TRINITY_DN48419_c0_g1~~TRINITY_DN48419_c0_g1_i1.p1  ORF type:complete len:561 (+),score=92.06 TRINITY_DN48419_c0_g1_i1:120-1802(+)